MNQKENLKGKAAADLETIAGAIAGELAPLSGIINKFFIGPINNQIAAKISESKALNVEELPPDVVRYWVAAKDILAREGYVLTINVKDWFANPDYIEVDARPVRKGDVFGYDEPPVRALFIISKATQKPATNAEILKSLHGHFGEKPVDYENHAAYGLELLVRAPWRKEKPDTLGSEVAEAFQQTMPGNRLVERKNVAKGMRDYSFEAIVLYQPQMPEEAKEAKPPLNYLQYRYLTEEMEMTAYTDRRMKQLTGWALSTGVAKTPQRNPTNSIAL